MQTTMIVDENIRLKGFNLIVSETEFLILSIALSRMVDSKYVNDKDRAIAERMHNDLYEVGADMAGIPQTDLAKESDGLVKDLVEDYEPYKYEIKALHKDYQEPYCEVADTPQTDSEITELAKEIVHKMIDNSDIAEDAYPDLRQRMHEAVERLDEYYPS